MVKNIEIKKLRTPFMVKFARAVLGFAYVTLMIAIAADEPKFTTVTSMALLVGSAILPLAHKRWKGTTQMITLGVSFSSLSLAWMLATEFARVLPYDQPIWLEAIGFGSLAAGLLCSLLGLLGILGDILAGIHR